MRKSQRAFFSYNMDWELSPQQARQMILSPPADSNNMTSVPIILDLRDEVDFKHSHFDSSLNLDVGASSKPNPYQDPSTLVALFHVLNVRLATTDPVFGPAFEGRVVITISYNGNVARLAMSILRSRGVQAHCVMGSLSPLEACSRDCKDS